MSQRRSPSPDLHLVYQFQASEDQTGRDAWLVENASREDRRSRLTRAFLLADNAASEERTPDMREAQEVLLSSAEIIAKERLPLSVLRSGIYSSLNHQWGSSGMISIFNSAARCAVGDGDHRGAFVWWIEGFSIFDNVRLQLGRDLPIFEWDPLSSLGVTLCYRLATTYFNFACRLYVLGNTAAALSYCNRGYIFLSDMSAKFESMETENDSIQSLKNVIFADLTSLSLLRHPEPTRTARLKVVDPDLQLNGSWKEIKLRSPGGISHRFESCTFAYDGWLYVFGGHKDTSSPDLFDFWRLNLSTSDKWESLPTFEPSYYNATGCQFALCDHRAYLFTGSLLLHCFNLKTRKWSEVVTTFKPDSVLNQWPFDLGKLGNKRYSMVAVDKGLYVFGGQPTFAVLGCDLLMELDLRSNRWQRLSGTYPPTAIADSSRPGPRMSPSSWVNRSQTKIFIMNGHATRLDLSYEARLAEARGGCIANYPYDELWSWDIAEKTWTKEKMYGNLPGPRSEIAAVYNRTLDIVIVFGGYNPQARKYLSNHTQLMFSYFAYTFILDMNEKRWSQQTTAAKALPKTSMNWRHVLTRGFPTYRALAHLVEDSTTGRTYLFSKRNF